MNDESDSERDAPAPSEEIGDVTFRHVMELWVTPELAKRQANGELREGARIVSAQVVFFPDGRPVQVRINDEVKAELRVVAAAPIKPGQLVYEHDITDVAEVTLLEEERDYGHITVLLLRSGSKIFFDFRQNQALSKAHADRSRQFLATAQLALDAGHLGPFVDNLFSAAELAVKSLLLGEPGPSVRSKRHGTLHGRFNKFAKLGRVSESERITFNALGSLRPKARYVEGAITISDDEAREMVANIDNLIARVDRKGDAKE